MAKDKQYVMILERSNENLSVQKSSDDYILEGVFAQFGVENNNHRIYEEKEYLPHLDYLKKKIAENRLLGELDHPDKFDISLQKVSHLIEEIKYDPKKRQIVGRIKLLDTPSGQIAKNLVDTGVPISISSRAAGQVGENKKVQIKRIFTYDLVADPGFENARLKKINESLGFSDDDNLLVYDVTNEFPGFFESLDSTEIYTQKEKIKDAMPQNEFVQIEEMNKYSLIIKEEIEKINERLNKISSISEKDSKIEKLEEEIKKLREYASYLAENQNKSIQYTEHIGKMLENTIGYAEHIAEKTDEAILYTQHVAEKADQGIRYSEMVAENVNSIYKYNDYLAEKVNQSIGYTEHVAKKTDESISHSNHIAEKLNETIRYAEHIAENTDNAILYAEHITENVATKKDFQNLTEYAEHMFESMVSKKSGKTSDVSENNDPVSTSVKESVANRYSDLDNKIEAILESIKKQKVEEKTNDARYPFIQFLGESKREEFFALSETEKQRVTNALKSKPSFEEETIVKVWESALAAVEVNEKWLTEMPLEFLPLWEAASSDIKDRISRQANLYNLNTPYQIKNFWQTRGLGKTEKTVVDQLNESKRVETSKTDINPLGYSNDHVKNVAAGLSRFKR